uniref:Uncharacterized protein n=1 Tax=Amphilophus citrinellus TaxID=61819 RepID=A0A3Q0T9B3_AMPCI
SLTLAHGCLPLPFSLYRAFPFFLHLSPLSIITPLLCLLHFRCFSSLSPALLPASPCRLLGGLLRNILSSPLRASVR